MSAASAKLVDVAIVSIEISLRGNRVIHASKDVTELGRYKTRLNPDIDIFKEVFAKLIVAMEQASNTVSLMIEDDRFIVRDPAFPV